LLGVVEEESLPPLLLWLASESTAAISALACVSNVVLTGITVTRTAVEAPGRF
jgi:hypothetical protein